MAHKLCPICNKHSIIERVCAIDSILGEVHTEWYCRTCKRIIKDPELYPEQSGYKIYQDKKFPARIIAKPLKDNFDVKWSLDKTAKIGDYKIINSKGLRLVISKEEFEMNFEEIKQGE